LIFVATLALLALVAGGAYAHWRFPSPLGCSVGLVRPQARARVRARAKG